MNFKEFIEELRFLNPSEEIRIGNPSLDDYAYSRIFCSTTPTKINLPKNFYFCGLRTITNKGNTLDGTYFEISFDLLKNADIKTLEPIKEVALKNKVQFPDEKYDFSFDGVKKTYDKYSFHVDHKGNFIITNKNTKIIYNDKISLIRAKFVLSWVSATLNKRTRHTILEQGLSDEDYFYAFNEKARDVYNVLMNEIQDQLLKTGNIDTSLLVNTIKECHYEYANSIVCGLFDHSNSAIATYDWVKLVTPDAMPKTSEITTTKELQYFKKI